MSVLVESEISRELLAEVYQNSADIYERADSIPQNRQSGLVSSLITSLTNDGKSLLVETDLDRLKHSLLVYGLEDKNQLYLGFATLAFLGPRYSCLLGDEIIGRGHARLYSPKILEDRFYHYLENQEILNVLKNGVHLTYDSIELLPVHQRFSQSLRQRTMLYAWRQCATKLPENPAQAVREEVEKVKD